MIVLELAVDLDAAVDAGEQLLIGVELEQPVQPLLGAGATRAGQHELALVVEDAPAKGIQIADRIIQREVDR